MSFALLYTSFHCDVHCVMSDCRLKFSIKIYTNQLFMLRYRRMTILSVIDIDELLRECGIDITKCGGLIHGGGGGGGAYIQKFTVYYCRLRTLVYIYN